MKRTKSNNLTKFASWKYFLADKSYFLASAFVVTMLALSFLIGFKVRLDVLIMLAVFWCGFIAFTLLAEFWRKRKFYQELLAHVAQLDQAYLVLETLSNPRFYDGEILYNVLYAINKSMAENVNKYRHESQEFQDYVEMWIHEVKTPLATLSLISHDISINEQIKRLDDCVEQILYFARAENAERDYLIKTINLEKTINTVATRNREILLAKHIDFQVGNLDFDVQTDSKWLAFILNQIVNNSIKYQSSKIKLSAQKNRDVVILEIYDNGTGISQKDLPRVFDKSFTGNNGRLGKQSTGMGLYIAKTLCDKLGHQITIESEKNKYTLVKIAFGKPEYFDVIDV